MLGNVLVVLGSLCVLFALQYILFKVLVFEDASIVQKGFFTSTICFHPSHET